MIYQRINKIADKTPLLVELVLLNKHNKAQVILKIEKLVSRNKHNRQYQNLKHIEPEKHRKSVSHSKNRNNIVTKQAQQTYR
jgi:hypothetical protein